MKKLNRFTIACLLALLPTATSTLQAASVRVYVGTGGGKGGGEGIYSTILDTDTGTLSAPSLAVEAGSPTFLAIAPDEKHLYAVGSDKSPNGWVVSYAIDAVSGKLTELNRESAGGKGSCFVSVSPNQQFALVANYSGGSCGMLPLAADGTLKPMSTFRQHVGGSGVFPKRQTAPYAHSATTSPDNRFVMVADLGLDQILSYRVDPAGPTMAPNDPPFVATVPGGGPRHFTFHPANPKWAYGNNELSNSVTAYSYDTEKGSLTRGETLSTLPETFTEWNSTSEVLVHPNGKFLYVANRGHNSIAAFAINPENGTLTAMGQTPCGGKIPRNFGIDPTGKWLLVANQDSDNVAMLSVNADSGALTLTGTEVAIPRPMCVRYLSPVQK